MMNRREKEEEKKMLSKTRETKGAYNILVTELCLMEREDYQRSMRMSHETFNVSIISSSNNIPYFTKFMLYIKYHVFNPILLGSSLLPYTIRGWGYPHSKTTIFHQNMPNPVLYRKHT